VWQADRAGFGLPSNFSLFAAALRLRCPDIRCTPLNIADGEALPFDTTLSDFEGVTFPGSPPPNDACCATSIGTTFGHGGARRRRSAAAPSADSAY